MAALDDVLRFCKDKKMAIKNLKIVSGGEEDRHLYDAVLLLNPNQSKLEDEVLLSRVQAFSGVVSEEILSADEL